MINIPLRPLNTNSYGVFQTPNTAVGDGSATPGYENWNWAGDWKRQMDQTKALGGSVFVLFGDFWWVMRSSGLTLATYIAQRKQVMDYALSIGLYVLSYESFTFTAWAGLSPGPLTNTQAIPILQAVCALVAQYPNYIGMVLNDEAFSGATNAPTVTALAAQYSAARAILPSNIPICATACPCGTAAVSAGNAYAYANDAQNSKPICDSIAAYCDFFAFNLNQSHVPAAGDLANLAAAFPGKQIVNVASYNFSGNWGGAAGMVGANNVIGASWFIFQDFGNSYGLYLSDGTTPRGSAITAFQGGIPSSRPNIPTRTVRGSPVQNQFLVAGY